MDGGGWLGVGEEEEEGACVGASALTAPQGGSMLREGTDPSWRENPPIGAPRVWLHPWYT